MYNPLLSSTGASVAEIQDSCYEQPLNERTRTFLRLEHLFAQSAHHERDETPWGRRATLNALLDVLTILTRHDLRTEVAKELSDQHATLSRLQHHSGIDHSRLNEILRELDSLAATMQKISPQFAAFLVRDNELLNAINNRSAIPGGTCGFDLPAYQHWLNRPPDEQRRHFEDWFEQLEPFRVSINLILRLIRDSADTSEHTAHGGILVHNTDTDVQLLRVFVARDQRVYPEISAGRHRSTIRFMEQSGRDLNVSQTSRDIPFRMACCHI